MVGNKVSGIISFKQIKWLEKNKNHKTQKRNRAEIDFKKEFKKVLNNAFYGRTMENVRKRIKMKFIRKENSQKIFKQLS